jgi:hypothetical protein
MRIRRRRRTTTSGAATRIPGASRRRAISRGPGRSGETTARTCRSRNRRRVDHPTPAGLGMRRTTRPATRHECGGRQAAVGTASQHGAHGNPARCRVPTDLSVRSPQPPQRHPVPDYDATSAPLTTATRGTGVAAGHRCTRRHRTVVPREGRMSPATRRGRPGSHRTGGCGRGGGGPYRGCQASGRVFKAVSSIAVAAGKSTSWSRIRVRPRRRAVGGTPREPRTPVVQVTKSRKMSGSPT